MELAPTSGRSWIHHWSVRRRMGRGGPHVSPPLPRIWWTVASGLRLKVLLVYETFNCVSGIYLICILAVSMLSLLITVFVLQMYHHQPEVPPPDWLAVVVKAVANLSCQFGKLNQFRVTVKPRPVMYEDQERSAKNHQDKRGSPIKEKDSLLEEIKEQQNDALVQAIVSQTIILNNILPELKTKSQNDKENYEEAWALAAAIIDRFCAIFLATIVAVVNFVMLYVIPLFAS